MQVLHTTINFRDIVGSPAVIILRTEPMAWRRCISPTIKRMAAEIVGRPVLWREINILGCLGDTGMSADPISGEVEWNHLLSTGKFVMYRSDAPGHLERVA